MDARMGSLPARTKIRADSRTKIAQLPARTARRATLLAMLCSDNVLKWLGKMVKVTIQEADCPR
jgi:hypothetical protein